MGFVWFVDEFGCAGAPFFYCSNVWPCVGMIGRIASVPTREGVLRISLGIVSGPGALPADTLWQAAG